MEGILIFHVHSSNGGGRKKDSMFLFLSEESEMVLADAAASLRQFLSKRERERKKGRKE